MGHPVAKIVALLALFAVLGSAQCLNFCTVNPCDKARATSVPLDTDKSCHRSPASSKPDPTPSRTDCNPQPMLVGEKVSFAATGLIVLSALPVSFVQPFPVNADLAIMTALAIGSPPTQVSPATVILRI